jgi:hypothetical protein
VLDSCIYTCIKLMEKSEAVRAPAKQCSVYVPKDKCSQRTVISMAVCACVCVPEMRDARSCEREESGCETKLQQKATRSKQLGTSLPLPLNLNGLFQSTRLITCPTTKTVRKPKVDARLQPAIIWFIQQEHPTKFNIQTKHERGEDR